MSEGFTEFNSWTPALLRQDCPLSPVLPDQFEVALGAGDVCGELIGSAAATRPVALWPGTAGVIQFIDLR